MKVYQKIFCGLLVFLFLMTGLDVSMHRSNPVLFLTEHHESSENSRNESHNHSDNSGKEFTTSIKTEDYFSNSEGVTVRLTFLLPENSEIAAIWHPPELL
jgi:hypothetical protein